MRKAKQAPTYRHHKARNLAVVRIDGHDHYLGPYNSPESHEKYHRLIAEWMATGTAPAPAPAKTLMEPAALSIAELIQKYRTYAHSYYVKDGRPTSEASLIDYALAALRKLYGLTPAADFGPKALKLVRQSFIDAGLCRREVNRRTGLITRFFKWCVEEELVPPSVHHGLSAVKGIRKGRSGVREAPPVKSVPDAFVDAIRPHVAPQVWAMIELQRLTGMRPGEVVIMRTCDLDTSGRVWVFTPESHKTEHLDKARQIYLGPKAQAVVKPWLRTELTAYLFSPVEVMAEHRKAKRVARKTKVQPSQRNRRASKPAKRPGNRYTTESYRRSLASGCDKAFPHPREAAYLAARRAAGTPAERKAATAEWDAWQAVPEHATELAAWRSEHRWHPNQLRHNAATNLRREFGLDIARVILGHSSPVVTEVYAEVDREKALRVMETAG